MVDEPQQNPVSTFESRLMRSTAEEAKMLLGLMHDLSERVRRLASNYRIHSEMLLVDEERSKKNYTIVIELFRLERITVSGTDIVAGLSPRYGPIPKRYEPDSIQAFGTFIELHHASAGINDVLELAIKLRETAQLMRTIPWIKGVIN